MCVGLIQDAHVGNNIRHDCISGFLQGRTRLLVTNALHVLDDADHVVVMKVTDATCLRPSHIAEVLRIVL